MSDYNFTKIEREWQKFWEENETYKVENNSDKPKFYVLDMFPYPSGAGLHVGHPLGYIASDIYARFKTQQGFNVLHPMGFDAFGLPAEQYALETGQHPAITTEQNIATYKKQLKQIGFNYDWNRELQTCDPSYYKWTQLIFLQLFNSWYNKERQKAESIDSLIEKFVENGTDDVDGATDFEGAFSATQWKEKAEKEQQEILLRFRLAYLAYSEVNWCPALGTVLANDEVKDGVSERGGHPVEKKKMRQWFLRTTAYADRLLKGLDEIDWPDALKEQQRNWIGRSEGALVEFHLSPPLSRGEGEKKPGYHTTDGQMWNLLIDKAKEMRKNPTEAELAMWKMLKGKSADYKFRRQHIIDRFIVDFVCLEKKLIVEVDGDIHNLQKEEDEERTLILNKQGYKVIRFRNEEVIGNTDEVIAQIKKQLAKCPSFKTEEVLPFGEDLGGVITVFTTRPDTIFGATFMVLAPEHELVEKITTEDQKEAIKKYLNYVKSRSDIERQQEKKVTGEFTGAYANNPFTNEKIPIWVAEYVLIGYGTGAIMAVPADDLRDQAFAEKFELPIIEVVDRSEHPGAGPEDKVGKMINSGFINGMEVSGAIETLIQHAEEKDIGKRQVQYKLRDAGFSRQRYWGEPFPIIYKNDMPYAIDESELPLVLPEVKNYHPAGDGQGPLANNTAWMNLADGATRETDTMPGYAGSSWYFLRYMDPHNNKDFVSKEAEQYWQNVDLYIGGAEHAVGHLMYARFWHKFLYDTGFVSTQEPFKKLINQGMITGVSEKVHMLIGKTQQSTGILNGEFPSHAHDYGDTKDLNYHFGNAPCMVFYSADNVKKAFEKSSHNEQKKLAQTLTEINVDISIVKDSKLDIEKFIDSKPEFADAIFICESGYWHHGEFKKSRYREGSRFFTTQEVEKMSKSKYNVVNPDDMVAKYGADCFRMYEMFLGPIEQHKPWDTKGIEGVSRFLKKLWKVYQNAISDEEPTNEELKILHKTIKKVKEDTERFSFNTAVSTFMICVNELSTLKCNKRKILEPLCILLSPNAPHIAEELWSILRNEPSVCHQPFPQYDEKYLAEDSFTYPVSFNGKMRFKLDLPATLSKEEIEKEVLACEQAQKWLGGNAPKKVIVVPKRIVNVVV